MTQARQELLNGPQVIWTARSGGSMNDWQARDEALAVRDAAKVLADALYNGLSAKTIAHLVEDVEYRLIAVKNRQHWRKEAADRRAS